MSLTPQKSQDSSGSPSIITPDQILKVYNSESLSSKTECPICLGSISPIDEDISQTRCRHTFHTKCLIEAKLRKSNCPICRAQLTPLPAAANVSDENNEDQNSSRGISTRIVLAAERGRNAVRLAIQRRELEQLQMQM